MSWTLTVRAQARVQRARFDTLERALAELEARGRELADEAPRRTVDVKIRRYSPAQQVTGRVELSGPERLLPTVSVGVDIRGDGSTEAYFGRVKRTLIEQRKGEDAYAALRRVLGNRLPSADQRPPSGPRDGRRDGRRDS